MEKGSGCGQRGIAATALAIGGLILLTVATIATSHVLRNQRQTQKSRAAESTPVIGGKVKVEVKPSSNTFLAYSRVEVYLHRLKSQDNPREGVISPQIASLILYDGYGRSTTSTLEKRFVFNAAENIVPLEKYAIVAFAVDKKGRWLSTASCPPGYEHAANDWECIVQTPNNNINLTITISQETLRPEIKKEIPSFNFDSIDCGNNLDLIFSYSVRNLSHVANPMLVFAQGIKDCGRDDCWNREWKKIRIQREGEGEMSVNISSYDVNKTYLWNAKLCEANENYTRCVGRTTGWVGVRWVRGGIKKCLPSPPMEAPPQPQIPSPSATSAPDLPGGSEPSPTAIVSPTPTRTSRLVTVVPQVVLTPVQQATAYALGDDDDEGSYENYSSFYLGFYNGSRFLFPIQREYYATLTSGANNNCNVRIGWKTNDLDRIKLIRVLKEFTNEERSEVLCDFGVCDGEDDFWNGENLSAGGVKEFTDLQVRTHTRFDLYYRVDNNTQIVRSLRIYCAPPLSLVNVRIKFEVLPDILDLARHTKIYFMPVGLLSAEKWIELSDFQLNYDSQTKQHILDLRLPEGANDADKIDLIIVPKYGIPVFVREVLPRKNMPEIEADCKSALGNIVFSGQSARIIDSADLAKFKQEGGVDLNFDGEIDGKDLDIISGNYLKYCDN